MPGKDFRVQMRRLGRYADGMTPGPLELGIVLLIALLIFGPKRLPGLGKQLGSGMREFKDGITGKAGEDDEETAKPVAVLPASPAVAPVVPPADPQAAASAPVVRPEGQQSGNA